MKKKQPLAAGEKGQFHANATTSATQSVGTSVPQDKGGQSQVQVWKLKMRKEEVAMEGRRQGVGMGREKREKEGERKRQGGRGKQRGGCGRKWGGNEKIEYFGFLEYTRTRTCRDGAVAVAMTWW
jgi:hypothetical protein